MRDQRVSDFEDALALLVTALDQRAAGNAVTFRIHGVDKAVKDRHLPDMGIDPRETRRLVELCVKPFAEHAKAAIRLFLLPGLPVRDGFHRACRDDQ